MVRAPGPYIVLRRISLTIWDFQRLSYKYCGLHHIPRKPRSLKAELLSYLYSVIITQQRADAENKRFDGFGDPPSTHPLSEVLGGVSNILNFYKSWQDRPITNQTHSFYNRTDIYHILPSTPLTVALCPLLMMNQIAFSFTSAMIAIYIYTYNKITRRIQHTSIRVLFVQFHLPPQGGI